ncbi:MAG: EpsG family protein [Luteimonas sp.]
MWPFWLMFGAAAFGVFSPLRLRETQAFWLWLLVGIAFAVAMGFRHEVGADWFNYAAIFESTSLLSLKESASLGDPGYSALNWAVAQLGGSVYWVNFACALVLACGTAVFCRRQPNPWLALLAATPYMLIVVGMGYTRQSVALGFALLGLSALGDARTRAFVVWVVIGALFHKSAVLLLPIAALAASRNRLLTGMLVVLATALAYYLLLHDSSEALWANYVEDELQSEGGAIRVAMNAVAALAFLFFQKRLAPDAHERRLWLWMTFFALACVPLVVLASTAVDRVALYLIPLQLFVFSRLPRLAGSTVTRTPLVLGIVLYYAAVQFVWLNYATHAEYWAPYHFMPSGQ